MSSPQSEKPLKRPKLTIQSPAAAKLQPPMALKTLKRDADSPLSLKHKNSLTEIKQSSKELKISTPTVKAKFDLNSKALDSKDETIITQVKRPSKQKPKGLDVCTSGSSSKAIADSFFSTCDSPEIREV
jgi:predicted nucleotidyltransferase